MQRYHKFMERFAALPTSNDDIDPAACTVDEVEQGWLSYRLLVGDWNRIRKVELAAEREAEMDGVASASEGDSAPDALAAQ